MPKLALHVPGQLISGEVDGVLVLVTVLVPAEPEIVTPKTGRVKVAVIVGLVAPIVTVQVIAVVQPGAPVQLEKFVAVNGFAVEGFAVSIT
jgi:hypothetical protein